MLHEVVVFKELTSFVIKDGGGHVVEELERVLS
jgi:hypothetical protein